MSFILQILSPTPSFVFRLPSTFEVFEIPTLPFSFYEVPVLAFVASIEPTSISTFSDIV